VEARNKEAVKMRRENGKKNKKRKNKESSAV